jgi:hypothetical protein
MLTKSAKWVIVKKIIKSTASRDHTAALSAGSPVIKSFVPSTVIQPIVARAIKKVIVRKIIGNLF